MRTQLLACRVPRVDAILYTHAHADHITGLDDVRILNRIVGPAAGRVRHAQTTLDEMTRPLRLRIPALAAAGLLPARAGAARGRARRDHRPRPACEVRLFEQDHGFIPSLGLRIGGFGYSTDVVGLDDAAFAALEGVDTWVVGCFLRQGPHKTHADLRQVAGLGRSASGRAAPC